MTKPLDRGKEDNMKEKILSLLGAIMLLVGMGLLLCLPYAESFQLWNAREGAIIAIPLIAIGITLWGIAAEERR
jgi:hypothetical protein